PLASVLVSVRVCLALPLLLLSPARPPPGPHPFPTRRSSDLVVVGKPGTADGFAETLGKYGAGEILAAESDEAGKHLITPEVNVRSEEHTSELQSRFDLVCRLLLERKNVS